MNNKSYIVELIGKIIDGKGTEDEEDIWMNEIIEKVPFYEGIYNELVFGSGMLTPKEIYEKAEQEYKPIAL